MPASSGFGGQGTQHSQQRVHGVVGEVRIGDVALRAVALEIGGDRAAAADFDGITEGFGVGGLADDAHIRAFADVLHPVEHGAGAVGRRAFLIAGDDQGNGVPLGQRTEHGFDRTHEAGDAGFHIDRAASVELSVDDFGRERRVAPRAFVPRRHHVGVAGEGKVTAVRRPARSEFDEQVGHTVAVDALGTAAQRFGPLRDIGDRPALDRGHRGASDQRLSVLN